MLNVSQATKTAYGQSSTGKNLVITVPGKSVTITNSDILQESLELTEAIENGDELTFTGCIASQLKFSVADIVQDLRGEYIEASITIPGTDTIPLFKGYVDVQTNRTHEDVVTEITAYDALYKKGQTDVTLWYNNLTFPITIKAFRDAFFSYLGITQIDITLANDYQYINKVITEAQILALDVMKAICQANGVYGQLGRDGRFKYIELSEITEALYPSVDTFPSETTYPSRENAGIIIAMPHYVSGTYEPFLVSAIEKVQVIGFDGAVSGTHGFGNNTLTIHDNIVAQGATNPTELAKNVYYTASHAKYVPSSIKLVGMPWIECGDTYLFNTFKNIIRAYVLNHTLHGINALYDEYTATGTQYREAYKETPLTQTTANEKNIQENAGDIYENTQRIIQTNQLLADEIYAEQIRTNTLVAQAIQTTELYADNITANAIVTTEAYADQLTANAISTTKLYADNITANSLITSKAYTDQLTANAITTTKLYADTVSTNKMNSAEAYAQQLTADKATISQLNATNATISQLNSELVSTNQVLATKASISQLNSVTISASQITAGTISTNRLNIDGIVQGMASKNLTVTNLSATGLITIGPYVAHWNSGTFKDGSGNNVTITYLGT